MVRAMQLCRGTRRKGRHRKSWEENIKDWTELEFDDFARDVENRVGWRRIIKMSSEMPRRPSRLSY